MLFANLSPALSNPNPLGFMDLAKHWRGILAVSKEHIQAWLVFNVRFKSGVHTDIRSAESKTITTQTEMRSHGNMSNGTVTDNTDRCKPVGKVELGSTLPTVC